MWTEGARFTSTEGAGFTLVQNYRQGFLGGGEHKALRFELRKLDLLISIPFYIYIYSAMRRSGTIVVRARTHALTHARTHI